jgi:hypothetical protein
MRTTKHALIRRSSSLLGAILQALVILFNYNLYSNIVFSVAS